VSLIESYILRGFRELAAVLLPCCPVGVCVSIIVTVAGPKAWHLLLLLAHQSACSTTAHRHHEEIQGVVLSLQACQGAQNSPTPVGGESPSTKI